jgi:glyoxylase-like metal-dependent hydrolase (beta-lactamase superfamily II)
MSALEIRTFVAPAFGQNAYLAWQAGSASAIAIDPGAEASGMADALAHEGLWCEAILLTHAHLDHIEGVASLVRRTGASVWLHPADRPLYDRAALQALQFGMHVEEPPAPDHSLEHGQVLELAGITLQVRHVPGHAPGHVIFYVEDAGVAFVGDVVFQGSIGRTDLPGGNFPLLAKGIRAQVLSLPDATTLYSGHGPPTTVGHERITNPFLVPNYGGGLA